MTADQKLTYGHILVDYHPHKEYPYCKCCTLGGCLTNYPGDIGTPVVDMLTYKLLFNSVLSTPYAKLMVIDIKKFYLNTPMYQYEYIILPIGIIPQDIID